VEDLEAANTIDIADVPTRQPLVALDDAYLAALSGPSKESDTSPRTIVTRRRIAIKPISLLALAALALLLVYGSMLLLNVSPAGLGSGLANSGAPVAHSTAALPASSVGAQSSPTGGILSGPLATPAGSSGSETPGLGTATPGATATTSSENDQPTLAVAPTKITILLCVSTSAQFTVTNTGDGSMTWSASAPGTNYTISPPGGALEHGQQQTVIVSGISAGGKVTVAAPGAANTPQTVAISCTL
jgi:hypothetical protein